MQTWKSIQFLKSSEKQIYVFACVLVLLFGGFVRFAYIESIPPTTVTRADAEKYDNLAHNILYHGSYSSNKERPWKQNTYITPGYPLFLAGVLSTAENENSFYASTFSIQAVFGALVVLLVFIIGKKFLPYWGAFLASFLTAISPQLVVSNGYVLTESLFTFFFLLSVFLLFLALKHKNVFLFLLFGLVAGYASLIRPVLLLFPVVIVLLPFLNTLTGPAGVRLRTGALVTVGILVLWVPWLAFKAQVEHTNASMRSPLLESFVLGTYPNLTFRTALYRGYPYLEDPDYKKMQNGFGAALEILGERAREKPYAYLRWYFLGKPVTYWQWGNIAGAGGPFIYPVKNSIYSTNAPAVNSLLFSETSHPLWLISALFIVITRIPGLFRGQANSEAEYVIYVLIAALAYFTAVHSVLAPLPRYSYPALPLLYLVAVYGIWRLAIGYKGISESVYNRLRIKIRSVTG